MNANHPDPLLQSILDDSKSLPESAAALARRRRRARANIHRGAALFGLLLACTIWLVTHQPSRDQTVNGLNGEQPAKLEAADATSGFVKVYSAGDPLPDVISPAASEEERRMLADLQGLPVVIVKDHSGRIARIHIIER